MNVLSSHALAEIWNEDLNKQEFYAKISLGAILKGKWALGMFQQCY